MLALRALTKQQMENILQDKVGLGNLQALPKSFNASKGKLMGDEWANRNSSISREYAAELSRQQYEIKANIRTQIKAYLAENAKRGR